MQDSITIQNLREKYIYKLDETTDSNEVANMSDNLFALDLTMYSKNNSLNSIFYNAFATSTLDETISLHPAQIEILNIFEKYSASIISAPTSFGKTFCIFEYINRVRPNSVVLIVPTLALIEEYKTKIITKYKESFSEYKIYTTISKDKVYDFSKKNIFILTHDKIVQENTYELFKKIDFLVIDEIYKLERKANDDRVLVLNMAYFYLAKIAQKYVLLAPFIKNIKNTELLDKTPYFYRSEYSPVVNKVYECEILDDKYRYSEANRINQEIPAKDKTLLYFGTVYSLYKYIEEVIINEPIINNVAPEIQKFIDWAKNEIHEDWSLIKALERGYLVHNGQIPIGIRLFQLNSYERNKNYNRLLCTSTLLEGVNTTAKNIIIVEPSRAYNENFSAFDFFNLVGRTGRLFKHLIGNAYYIRTAEDNYYNKEDAKKEIEFEITTSSEDVNFQKGEYDKCTKIIKFIQENNMSIEDYIQNIGFKLRFETVNKLYNAYKKHKSLLLQEMEKFCNAKESKKYISRTAIIKPLYYICEDKEIKFDYKASFDAECINSLLNKLRPKIKLCIGKVLKRYPDYKNINKLISKLIKFKNGYIEHQFYRKVSIIQFFMQKDGVDEKYINTISTEVLNVIDILYFTNSASKKLLYDMGFYEKDIEIITNIIGENFDDINDLRTQILKFKALLINRVSYISSYVIENLL